MKPKIIVTSPNSEFSKLVEKVSREKDIKIKIIEAMLEEAVSLVSEAVENDDYEVVVSRSRTAVVLRQAIDIPVVTAEFSDFDLLHTLWEAKKMGPKIAYFDSSNRQTYKDKEFLDILGTDVNNYAYETISQLKKQIKKAHEDKVNVVVACSGFAKDFAESLGMKGLVVPGSYRTVEQNLLRAEEVVYIRKRDKEYYRRLCSMMQAVSEGVICIDSFKNIILINDYALKLLNIKKNDIPDNFPIEQNEYLSKLLKIPNKSDKKYSINGIDLVVNRVSVEDKNEYFGEVFTFKRLSQLQQLEQKIRKESYKKGLIAKFKLKDIITNDTSMLDIIEKARNFARVDSTLLIIGESGCGKELLAQGVHRESLQSNGPFVAINCAALPKELLESELFGYEEGSFTGAKKGGKNGLFELAHKGTLFLDEIGSIPKDLQARLLRVLQEKVVMRIGGDSVIPVDVRCIAATNENLQEAIRQGEFRRDLYFRLNVLKLRVPPLRERKKDIVLLTDYFLASFNTRFKKNIKNIPQVVNDWMKDYSWPGNVRELENFIERMVIMANHDVLDKKWAHQLISEGDEEIISASDNEIGVQLGTLDEMEEQLISVIADRYGDRKSDLAKILGISRTTLWKKLNKKDYVK